MTDVRVRNLNEEVIAELKAQAKRHGKSLESELRDVITDAAWRPRREMVESLRKLHEAQRLAHGGPLPDSTPIIREERDRMG